MLCGRQGVAPPRTPADIITYVHNGNRPTVNDIGIVLYCGPYIYVGMDICVWGGVTRDSAGSQDRPAHSLRSGPGRLADSLDIGGFWTGCEGCKCFAQ